MDQLASDYAVLLHDLRLRRALDTHGTRGTTARTSDVTKRHGMSANPVALLLRTRVVGRLAAGGLVLLAGTSLMVVHIAASPSGPYQPASLHAPLPIQRPLPLPAGSPFAVAIPARATSQLEQPVQAVRLPGPLDPSRQKTLSGDDALGADSQTGPPIEAALVLLLVALLGCSLLKRARPAAARRHVWRRALAGLSSIALAGCGGSVPVGHAQTPDEYLGNALYWIEEHALTPDEMDWQQVRRDALAMAPHPRTTAETYTAIRFSLRHLHDSSAFFLEPQDFAELSELGVTALYPRGTVVFVQPRSPAAAAGIREGDILESINGEPLRPHGGDPPEGYAGTWFVDTGRTSSYHLVLRQANQSQALTRDVPQTSARYDGEPVARRFDAPADGAGSVAYIDLPWDGGWAEYATRAQRAIRAVDTAETCAWIVDLRHNIGGDFWTYLAAIGPVLGEDDLGGFTFPSGAREAWAYRGGEVLWDGRRRDESYVADPMYALKHQRPPVAILTSHATFAAGELLRVAFQGRSASRSFGEPTGGKPVLQLHTTLSDGAHLSLGAAYAFDRTGRTYSGPVSPDEFVATDWTRFGAADDPVVLSALSWAQTQPGCAG